MDQTVEETGRDFADVIRSRFSCRAFLDTPLQPELIRRIVTLAQQAPSWCNTQPWTLHVTTGDATRKLSAALIAAIEAGETQPDLPHPARYEGVYLERRRAAGWALYESVGIARGDRAASARQAMHNFSFFGAPHVAIVTTEQALGIHGAIDCGCFIDVFCLAAESLGVATIAQAALTACAPTLHRHLRIPDHRQIVCGISFGLKDETHPANSFRTDREDADAVIDWVH